MKQVMIVVCVLVLAGCATAYKPAGWGGGYSDMKLQDDLYKVSFGGNAYTSKGKVENYALLRSAELALENGYKYFIIVKNDASIATSSFTTPARANTTGSVYGSGNYATYSGTTTVSGGQTYVYNKPSADMTIKCFKEDPKDVNGLVYDAQQIMDNLKSQYKLQ